MPNVIVRPGLEQQAYAVKFHVRLPARATADLMQRRLQWSLERMIPRLARQGWTFVRLDARPPRGPLPVVPVKGFGKPPPKRRRVPGQPSPPPLPDDSLVRVSTLPTFGPKGAHLMTDEVDWEYSALFHRPTIPTAYVQQQGEPEPAWLKH
jgi:hypothetical protein